MPHKQEFLNILINHVPAAVAFLDRNLRYVAASRRWRSDFGLEDRELTDEQHYAVFPEISAAWKEEHQRALHGESVESEKDRFVRSDGTEQWLHRIVRPWYAPDGDIGGIVILSEDITERLERERRLRHLNGILDGIRKVSQIIARDTEPHQLIQRACEALVESRGFLTVAIVLTEGDRHTPNAHAMAGRELVALRGMLVEGQLPGCAADAIASGKGVLRSFGDKACSHCPVAPERQGDTDELAFAIAHGDHAYGFMLVCMPQGMGTNADESSLLQEISDDIAFALYVNATESQRDATIRTLSDTEAQLRQAQKLESIGRLAGGIAHDFNNMLAAQMGYCELMAMRLGESHPIRPDLEKIMACAERSAGLTRQLLAFSRKQTLQPEVLDLNAVVEQIEKMLQRLIGEDITLCFRPRRDLSRIKVDRGQIEQVIMNLAVNARDAMPTGGKLTIETTTVDLDETYAQNHLSVHPGPHVMLSVADNGCGMDEATQHRMFEPFYTTKPVGQGTGLGLSTVYGIVKQSGGNIWVYSEPGHGTTFKIYLPCVDEALTQRVARGTTRTGGRGELILIVEDNATLREVFAEMVGKLGYRVHATGDADEALAAIDDGLNPDLLFTDVIMPGLSGPALAEKLMQIRPQLKVVYTSGYTDDTIVRYGALDDGAEFLQKPFNSSVLAEKLRTVLDT